MTDEAPASPLQHPPVPADAAPPALSLQDAVMHTVSNLIHDFGRAGRMNVQLDMIVSEQLRLLNVEADGVMSGVIRDTNTKRARSVATRARLFALTKRDVIWCAKACSMEIERMTSTLAEFRDVAEKFQALPPVPLDAMPVDEATQRAIEATKKRQQVMRVLRPARRAK